MKLISFQDSKAEAVVSTIMELEKLYSNRIMALEKALVQKDDMVQDLEEQNRNMVRLQKTCSLDDIVILSFIWATSVSNPNRKKQ